MMKKLRTWLHTTLTTSSPQGSGLGVFLRTKASFFNIKQLFGFQLTGLAFVAAVVVPQAKNTLASLEIVSQPTQVLMEITPTETKYQWPMDQFGVSQYFSVVHPGLDLTNPEGTPVYPITDGIVTFVRSIPVGYGNHVFVTHDNHIQSLYAHFSKILVHEGQKVDKNTILGEVGATGWATGNHVHLEVYQNGAPTNPLEVLPDIKKQSQ